MNDIDLARGFHDPPDALEAGADDEGVAGANGAWFGAVFDEDRQSGKDRAEFPLVVIDAPGARRRLPNAGQNAAVVAPLHRPGRRTWRAVDQALRRHVCRGRRRAGQIERQEELFHGGLLLLRTLIRAFAGAGGSSAAPNGETKGDVSTLPHRRLRLLC